jgi:hypothetical protein
MRKASSKSSPAAAGDADSGRVLTRESADFAWHVHGTAVTLPGSQGGQATCCQWLHRSVRPGWRHEPG